MTDIFWLLVGNAIFWLGMGTYTLFIGSRQNRLERQLKQLEILNNDNEKD